MGFDIKTIMIFYILINLISAGAMFVIWRQNKKHFRGLGFWLADMVLQALGVLLIMMRGQVPDFISFVLSNTLIFVGLLFLLIGMARFVGVKIQQVHNYILLVTAVIIIAFYSLFHPNLTMREIMISTMIVLINAQTCWLLFRKANEAMRRITFITGIVMGAYIIVSLARILLLTIFPAHDSDFFRTGLVDAVSIILYISLGICLLISIALMVNKRLLEEVQAEQEKFTLAFKSSPYAVTLTRASDGVIFEANEGFEVITGYPVAEVVGMTTVGLKFWDREEDLAEVVRRLSQGEKVEAAEFQFRKKSGALIVGHFSASNITINGEQCILSSISDITELSQIKERLEVMATHDPLTGLPNRVLFYERVQHALENAKQTGTKLAIATLDLDKFKSINDQFGHDVGDQVLRDVARRLEANMRVGDTVSRFGGDEFILVLPEIGEKEAAGNVAHQILEAFRQPFILESKRFDVTVSIGIVLYPADGIEINELIKNSDFALYDAKGRGGNRVRFYSETEVKQ